MTDVPQTQTDQPVPPTATPAEAASRLGALKENKEWTGKLMAGSPAELKEFQELHKLSARGDDAASLSERVAQAMTGPIQSAPDSEAALMNFTAGWLREIGIRDEVILETLSNREASQTEFDAVKNWRERAMRDHEFVKRYLNGDMEARQKMTLSAIVLSSDIKGKPRGF